MNKFSEIFGKTVIFILAVLGVVFAIGFASNYIQGAKSVQGADINADPQKAAQIAANRIREDAPKSLNFNGEKVAEVVGAETKGKTLRMHIQSEIPVGDKTTALQNMYKGVLKRYCEAQHWKIPRQIGVQFQMTLYNRNGNLVGTTDVMKPSDC